MRKRFLSLSLILGLCVLLSPAFAFERSSSGEFMTAEMTGTLLQSKEFRKTVEFAPGGNLTLKTDKGSVRLTSWGQNQVEIYARIDPPEDASADYGALAVEAAKVEVQGDARSLTIRSNFEDVPHRESFFHRGRSLPHIHYEIRAPRNLNLNLNVDRSKVEVSGFEGSARLNTDRTPVNASDLTGDIRFQMDRGKATLSGFSGSLDLDVDRTDVELKAVRIEGDSRFEIDRGELEVGLPDSQGLSISANISRRGDLFSDFGVIMQSKRGRNFEATINGGGPKLYIHADRAQVRLKRR